MQDYTQTSFADETFDHIWALESICCALKKTDFIKEAYRILKKGGGFAIADGFACKRNLTEKEWQPVLQVFKWLGDAKPVSSKRV